MAVVRHKEAIHSGQFMISEFEAEAEDEEDIAVPPTEEGSNIPQLITAEEEAECIAEEGIDRSSISTRIVSLPEPKLPLPPKLKQNHSVQAIIDVSLNKLFQSMSIAYRQKLTSPKWNRFRGLKLRWKDKIRLNNVIWRCWHMQFIKGQNRLLCSFANPLEIDHHNSPEGGTVLEGKYWKRKLQTITKEYKKWRMFCKNRGAHEEGDITDDPWESLFQSPFQLLEGSKDDAALEALAPEEDFFVDALFGSLQFESSSRASTFAPVSSKDACGRLTTNSDFIQPALAPLQPNLEEFFSSLESAVCSSECSLSKMVTYSEAHSSCNQAQAINPFIDSDQQATQSQSQEEQQQFLMNKKKLNEGMQDSFSLEDGNLSANVSSVVNFQNSYDQQGEMTKSDVPAPVTTTFVSPSSNSALELAEPLLQQSIQPEPMDIDNVIPQTNPVNIQAQAETFSSNGYTFSAQKRLTGPITCASEKRHSPKHRILHHRDYQRDFDFLNQDQNGFSVDSGSQCQTSSQTSVGSTNLSARATNGLISSASPYKLPSAVASVASSQSISYLEPRMRAHSFSGSSDYKYKAPLSGSRHAYHSRILHSNNLNSSLAADPNSELIQLLKNNKTPLPSGHQDKEENKNTAQKTPASSRKLFESKIKSENTKTSTSIPPPPTSSAPQPKMPVNTRSSRAKASGRIVTRQRSKDQADQGESPVVRLSQDQIRRGSIKNGFDLLKSILPSLSQNPGAKISKAALLHRGGDYLKELLSDKSKINQEISLCHNEIGELNQDLTDLLKHLSRDNSSQVVSQDTLEQLDDMFWSHVKECTRQNWKYWIFALIMHPLLTSFQSCVKAESHEEMARSSIHWIDQFLSPNSLRPIAVKSLKQLCLETSILNEPEKLPIQAVTATTAKKCTSAMQEEPILPQ